MTLPVPYGHASVWQRLTALLDADRLPHALLFTGPPGIGKALVARRLMAYLACSAPERPCGDCAGCRQVVAGSHPDLLAIAAPSRRKDKETRKKEIGVEQARQLKRFAQLHAVAAVRKMAIVDDADRLTIAAQNALLKTLEEPPGGALLVLVTAAPDTLLTTVRSRCQRVLFQPLADADLRAALAALGVGDDAAARVFREAGGSPGRALALIESWTEEDRQALETLLADLDAGRYGSVLAMSKGLGKTEADTAARLDGLLAICQRTAREAVAAGDAAALGCAVRRAAAVGDAQRALRWNNPNRTLLTEALALRLARARSRW